MKNFASVLNAVVVTAILVLQLTRLFKIVKSVVEGNTSYTKYDLEKGKAYSFKVRAYAEVEGRMSFSAYSEMKSITAK